jgi:hypothetical protein
LSLSCKKTIFFTNCITLNINNQSWLVFGFILYMDNLVAIDFFDYQANYHIYNDRSGAYIAKLDNFNGPAGIKPPDTLVLERGMPRWISTSDEEEYNMEELDRYKESRVRKGDPNNR